MSTRLQLRVVPGASRSAVVGRHGAGWKVRVAAPPADGRANAALVRLLAETLDVAPRDLEIVSGHASREKIVQLTLDPEQTERLLAAASGAGKESP